MTFTYATNLSTDLAKVRFHIGDTSSEGAYLSDEEINALVTSEGSVGGAVIACIRYILTQLSTPNFKKDWLSVDYEKARLGYEKLLVDKAEQFGISLKSTSWSTGVNNAYRGDSYQYTSTARTATTKNNTDSYDGTP